MHRGVRGSLLVLSLLLLMMLANPAAGQCLYPEWETTCQNYCLANQYYNIQLNQCWSKDPKNLRCRCANRDFTDIIKGMLSKSKKR